MCVFKKEKNNINTYLYIYKYFVYIFDKLYFKSKTSTLY